MLILNFGHPLTDEQIKQIEALANTIVEEVHNIPVQINQDSLLDPQITSIVSTIKLSQEEWRTRPILINSSGFAPAAFVLLAELHGRIGRFPSLIRLRPKPQGLCVYPKYSYCMLTFMHEVSTLEEEKDAIRVNAQALPKPGPIRAYEVAELLNLQSIREQARRRR